jgi:hypothetical protein
MTAGRIRKAHWNACGRAAAGLVSEQVMRTELRLLIVLVAAAAVASIVTPAGGAATLSLGALGPCCFSELPLHYDAEPGETNDVQIFMTVFGDGPFNGAPSGTWIVIDNGAAITTGAGCTSLDAHSEVFGATRLDGALSARHREPG